MLDCCNNFDRYCIIIINVINIINVRRRAVQFHYASSHCKPQKCPRAQEPEVSPYTPSSAPHYFDCDPTCQEPEYWYYRKGEMLIAGRDMGGDYI